MRFLLTSPSCFTSVLFFMRVGSICEAKSISLSCSNTGIFLVKSFFPVGIILRASCYISASSSPSQRLKVGTVQAGEKSRCFIDSP